MHGIVCQEIRLLTEEVVGGARVENPNMICIYLGCQGGFSSGHTCFLNGWEARSTHHILVTCSAYVQFDSGFTMVT
jgi:hypothetical protein